MKRLIVNTNIRKPVFDVSEGVYEKTQIVIIDFPGEGRFPIYYSTDGSFPDKKYWGPLTISETCTLKAITVIANSRSEVEEATYTINKTGNRKRGHVCIIGGAEHCKEIHQEIVEKAGGANIAKIAFMPASSAEPYEAGMDRKKRFSELANVHIDETLVPKDENGEPDFSHIDNTSNFWIIPDALIDDENRPHTDQSLWRTNGFRKEYAEKLRDGEYNIIFLTGGNQARYMKCLFYPDGTEGPLLSIIKETYKEHGGVIAGTSAGGAFMSPIMMLGGSSYGSMSEGVYFEDVILHDYFDTYQPYTNKVWLGTGAGFISSRLITDTHFVARGRIGRLITACLYLKKQTNRTRIGIGVDEDSAVMAYPDYSYKVIGVSGVVLIDTFKVDINDIIIEKGNYRANNVVIHYLNQGDRFYIDKGSKSTGKLSVEIAGKETIYAKKQTDLNIELQPDVFGKDRIKKWLYKALILNKDKETVGIEMIDNLEDSYDFIADFHDVTNDKALKDFKDKHNLVLHGSTLLRFRKSKNTRAYKSTNTYHWWGSRDVEYPNLVKEEYETYSAKNIYVDVIPLRFINFPDFSDGKDIPLKYDRAYEERPEEWRRIFDMDKKSKFGIIIIPTQLKNVVEIRSFRLDYAYYDDDRDRQYTPPRLMENPLIEGEKVRFDYDIVEMNAYKNVEIFVNETGKDSTNEFGKKLLQISENKEVNLVFKFFDKEKKHTKLIEIKQIKAPLQKAMIAFSDTVDDCFK